MFLQSFLIFSSIAFCEGFSKHMTSDLPITAFTNTVEDSNMWKTYDQLSNLCYNKLTNDKNSGQFWIGIAGGPGAGKSTLAENVCTRLNKLNKLQPDDIAVVLPMDGFHYSRSELREMAEKEGSNTTFDELISRRGAPWTFNGRLCADSFLEAKRLGEASLPVYSRKASDPVPNGVVLKQYHKIVLVEVNYLFIFEDTDWAVLRG